MINCKVCMRRFAWLVMFVSFSAHAQSPQPQDRLKLDLSRAEIQTIINGLSELPLKTAAPVLNELMRQVIAQEIKQETKPTIAPQSPQPPQSKK